MADEIIRAQQQAQGGLSQGGGGIGGLLGKAGRFLAPLGRMAAGGLIGSQGGNVAGYNQNLQYQQMAQQQAQRKQRMQAYLSERAPHPMQNDEDYNFTLDFLQGEGAYKMAKDVAELRNARKMPKLIKTYDEGTGKVTYTREGEAEGMEAPPSSALVNLNMGDEGGPDWKSERDFTKDVRASAKQFETARRYHAQAARTYEDWKVTNNPQAYQVIGMSLQKILDPDSVVRNSEFGRSERFQSLYDKWDTYKELIMTGNPSDKFMKSLMDQVDVLAQAAVDYYEPVYETNKFIAERHGFPEQLLGPSPASVLAKIQANVEAAAAPDASGEAGVRPAGAPEGSIRHEVGGQGYWGNPETGLWWPE